MQAGDRKPSGRGRAAAALAVGLTAALAWAAPAIGDNPAGEPGTTGLAPPAAPSTPPSISGTPKAGLQLTGEQGEWNATADEWLRCHSDGCVRTGVTTLTYELGAADIGKTIVLRETGTGLLGTREVDSDPTATVASNPPVPPATIAAPSGTPEDRRTLTASNDNNDNWTGPGGPFSFTHQWQRCSDATTCVDIPSATDTTYALTPADVGKTIRVAVTATGAYGQATSNSDRTATVTALAPFPTGPAPALTGTAKAGQSLSLAAGTGAFDGTPVITRSFQWVRCRATTCADIAGATAGSYSLRDADRGARIKIRVTGSNGGGQSSQESPLSATVADDPPQPGAAAPAITGTARDGELLQSSEGDWSGPSDSGTLTYARAWQRCTAPGTCSDIAGATSATYRLTPADVGRTIRVIVTATGYGSSSRPSAETAPVAQAPPAATARPVIYGRTVAGSAIAVYPGTWAGTPPLSFSYEWLRCDLAGTACDTTGVTSPSYQLGGADIGARMRVRVRAENGAGFAFSDSDPSAVIAAPPAGGGGGGTGGGGGGTGVGSVKPKTPRLKPFPVVVIAGRVTGAVTLITRLSVRAPRGSRVTVRCRGRCAFGRARTRTLRGRSLRLASAQGLFGSGATVEIRVTKKGFIGKYTRFRFRTGLAPARIDRCVEPGRARPVRCAST